MLKFLAPLLFIVLLIPLGVKSQTNFGISPTTIYNHNLLPGSVYNVELNINYTGKINNTLKIIKNMAMANNWIEINNNQPINLNASQNIFKIPIRISIPKDVKLGRYTGSIDFITNKTASSTSISANIGTKIYVNLFVTKKTVNDIQINNIKLIKAIASSKIWKINIPGYVILNINFTNHGNTKKVKKDIYLQILDSNSKKIITKTVKTKKITILPFTNKKTQLKIPIKQISEGGYLGIINIIDQQNSKLFSNQQLNITFRNTNNNFWQSLYWLIQYYFKIILTVIAVFVILIMTNLTIIYKNYYNNTVAK